MSRMSYPWQEVRKSRCLVNNFHYKKNQSIFWFRKSNLVLLIPGYAHTCYCGHDRCDDNRNRDRNLGYRRSRY